MNIPASGEAIQSRLYLGSCKLSRLERAGAKIPKRSSSIIPAYAGYGTSSPHSSLRARTTGYRKKHAEALRNRHRWPWWRNISDFPCCRTKNLTGRASHHRELYALAVMLMLLTTLGWGAYCHTVVAVVEQKCCNLELCNSRPEERRHSLMMLA